MDEDVYTEHVDNISRDMPECELKDDDGNLVPKFLPVQREDGTYHSIPNPKYDYWMKKQFNL